MRTFMGKLHLLRFHVWNFFWWYKNMAMRTETDR